MTNPNTEGVSRRTLGALVAVIALLLTACTGGGDAGGGTDEPGAGPNPGGTLRIATPYTTTALDPIKSVAAGDIEILGQLYSRLLRMSPDGKELLPGLAKDWESSDDKLAWTFHLRAAKFSDETPLTAKDVVFSFNRLVKSESSVYSGPFQAISDVTAEGDRTVRFELKYPSASFLGSLTMFNSGIVPKDVVEKREEEFASDPVSSGPFRLREWKKNERVILERNPHYWRENLPYLGAVEFIEAPNDRTRVSMLQAGEAGEADVVQEAPWSNLDQLDKQGMVAPFNPSSVINLVLLNHKDELLSDLKVRKALALAIDHESLTKAVTFGNGTPANSPLSRALTYYAKNLGPVPYAPKQAQKLLQQAGATGAKIEFLVLAGDDVANQATQLIQAQLKKVGLKPSITQVDRNTWWDKLTGADCQATVAWYYNETPDPDQAVRWALCGACGNDSFYTYYNNDRVNELTEEAAREQNPQQREKLYQQIQGIALDDVAQIPLYYQPWSNVLRPEVKGVRMDVALQWRLDEAWIS